MSNFNARIKLKRDTAVNWTVNNPVLLNGEIILIDTDSGELRAKVGDGTKTYTQLPFTDEILRNLITNKQNKLTGTQGQIVGFDEDGNAIAQDKPVLYVNMTTTDDENFTSDKTATEIITAVEQGYSVIAKLIFSDEVYYTLNLFYIGGAVASFSGTIETNSLSVTLTGDSTSVKMQAMDLQSSIKGTQGQIVGFDSRGKPIAQEAPSGLPEGGTDGKILGYGSSGPQWIDAPKATSFVIQAEAPSDTSLLWINSSEHTLNYWDGSAWVKTVGVWG